MTRTSYNGSDNYQYTVVAAVTNVTNIGNKAGQNIEINGTGFSTTPEKNKV